ncbi:CCR4-Not complex component, Not1-domain-containing protein [Catenaria anguillulae PL171]|uniref:General negative regulator of transcription subunit 1 n=1 Tax=Catenaria anguillulae PL171 TaxID=765915 RepID=A0A1Y2I0H2_9FUNG|nr:CCR4-Not complex component, Not1-domain-containing protein [Catenaria anguillulae PL171]
MPVIPSSAAQSQSPLPLSPLIATTSSSTASAQRTASDTRPTSPSGAASHLLNALYPSTNRDSLAASSNVPSSSKSASSSLARLSNTAVPVAHLARFLPTLLTTPPPALDSDDLASFDTLSPSHAAVFDLVDRTGLHQVFLRDVLTLAVRSIPDSALNSSTVDLFAWSATSSFEYPGLVPLIRATVHRAFQGPTPVWYKALTAVSRQVSDDNNGGDRDAAGVKLVKILTACGAKPHELFVVGLAFLPAFSTQEPAHELALDLVSRGTSILGQYRESAELPIALYEYINQASAPAFPLIARRVLSMSTLFDPSATMSSSNASAISEEKSIAALLRQAGFNVLATADVFHQCLVAHMDNNSKLVSSALADPAQVGRALGTMIMTCSDLPTDPATAPGGSWTHIINDAPRHLRRSSWNVDEFISAVHAHASPAPPDWVQVVKALDFEGFQVKDLAAFELLLDVYRKGATKSGSSKKFPIKEVLFTPAPWQHPYAQYSLLVQCVSAPPDMFNFSDYSEAELAKVVPPQVLAVAAGSGSKAPIVSLPNQALNALDVHATLLQLLKAQECASEVKQFLSNASIQAPEMLLLGLVQLPGAPWDGVHAERVAFLTKEFLLGRPTSAFVLKEMWRIAPDLVRARMVELHREDASRLGRLLDVCQELKVLGDVLKSTPFTYALDLAALASRREFLNLERWIAEMVGEHGAPFAKACVEYVKVKLDAPKSPLSVEVANLFAKALTGHKATLPADLVASLAELSASLQARNASGFNDEIEKQALEYFDSFYKDEFTLEAFIGHLMTLSQTQERASQDLFACAVSTFMEERKFFASYPERTLMASAAFLGQLIANNLLVAADTILPASASSDKQKGTTMQDAALAFILEGLSQTPTETSKMFHFGFRAVQQFALRIPEFPSFATSLAQIPGIQQSAPEIVQLIQDRLPSKPFKAINVDEALVAGLEAGAPPDNVQDKLLFIMNNLSLTNVENKVKDAQNLLPLEYFRWFASHLVRRRAAREANYQGLYQELLRGWGSTQLDKAVLYETYTLAEAVLNSEKAWEEPSERTKLKHIGSWLGGLTLARDRPIMYKHLAMKELLLEGYDHQRLVVAVPFVCQVLKEASQSTVFLPPNPWLMAILGVLVELYHFADIKLNLKFEIEVLCKSISIELSEIRPTELLKFRRTAGLPAAELAASVAADVVGTAAAIGGAGVLAPGAGAAAVVTGSTPPIGPMLPGPPGMGGMMQEPAHVILANLATYIVLNPTLMGHPSPGGLKRLMHIAFDRAIRETLAPVVERSVTIAAISTRELVAKDFSSEPDEVKMRKASHLMSQHLAGSLALVTCKEPLRLSMASHLRTLMLQNGLTEQVISDQLLQLLVGDNLDLGCHIVARAAMEKAAPELDEQLAPALLKRKRTRELGQQFFELPPGSSADYQRRLAGLPDPLKLKVGGLTPFQLAVYEEYARGPGAAGRGGEEGGAAGVAGSEEVTLQQSIDRFTKAMSDLETQLAEASMYPNLAELPPSNETRTLIRQITQYLPSPSNPSRDDVALMFCTKVLQPLYSATTDIAREAYALVLRELCGGSVRAGREVVQWLLYAEDERKYNVLATAALIRVQVIPVALLDAQLGRLIESGKNLVEYATEVINVTLQLGLAASQDWFNTVNILFRLEQAGKAPEAVRTFLTALRQQVIQGSANGRPATDNDGAMSSPMTNGAGANGDVSEMDRQLLVRDRLTYLFTEWVKVTLSPSPTEQLFESAVRELQRSLVFTSENECCLFIRLSLEHSINVWFEAVKANAAPAIASQAIDAFAKLIVMLTKYHDEAIAPAPGLIVPATLGETADPELVDGEIDTPAVRARLAMFKKMYAIVVLSVTAAHEVEKRAFNQRPYFRLFSSLMYELNWQETAFQPISLIMLKAIGDGLHVLQPATTPGFAFSWLALIAHRQFMPKLLLQDGQRGWPVFARLSLDLFRSLVPFLREGFLREPQRHLYRGALRLLLVLLHDFPEFLCEHYYSLCAAIPPGCLQLRNLVLSAFPRSMRLPDPFNQTMRMDVLPESHLLPSVPLDLLYDTVAQVGLSPHQWEPVLAAAKVRLTNGAKDEVTGSTYNVPLIHAIVLLSGHQDADKTAAKDVKTAENAAAVAASPASTNGSGVITIDTAEGSTAHFIRSLLAELDSEGRYHVLSAITNHLRYPNAHTKYFSELLLYLFQCTDLAPPVQANGMPEPTSSAATAGINDALQEQITRVLLERLIANRPHPWGLLVTFIELIKDTKYDFWSHGFTRCAPDLERLFESVSRSVNHH